MQLYVLKYEGVKYMMKYYRHSVMLPLRKFIKVKFFSSPEVKAQVRFSDCLSSVSPSVFLSVNFSQFHLTIQNHWGIFNQTLH